MQVFGGALAPILTILTCLLAAGLFVLRARR